MTAKRVTVEALIPWPPETVFDFIADPVNDPRWCPTVSDIRLGTPSADGLERYTFVQHVGALQHDESAEVVELVRPERLRWRFSAFGSTVQTTIELRAEGSGTRLVQTNGVSAGPLRWFAQKRIAQRELPRQLVALAKALEYDRATDVGTDPD
jgi:uncharacterized protein YndB with AHSA1/START domain